MFYTKRRYPVTHHAESHPRRRESSNLCNIDIYGPMKNVLNPQLCSSIVMQIEVGVKAVGPVLF
jgi:hypothetical protein